MSKAFSPEIRGLILLLHLKKQTSKQKFEATNLRLNLVLKRMLSYVSCFDARRLKNVLEFKWERIYSL